MTQVEQLLAQAKQDALHQVEKQKNSIEDHYRELPKLLARIEQLTGFDQETIIRAIATARHHNANVGFDQMVNIMYMVLSNCERLISAKEARQET